jgi:hypothetical protein
LNKRNHLLCLWCVAIGVVVVGIGFWPVANYFPPHQPLASAGDIAAIYHQHTFSIRLGMVLMQIGAAMVFPLVALIAIQMRRIEGAHSVLASTQMVAGVINVLFLLLPPFIWTVAAYRPERSPELTQLINDIGWLAFLMPITPAVIQNFSIGIAVLSDRSARPVFPRWVAFLNFFVALCFISDLLITFFKTGPFAWNGALAFYLPFVVFSSWIFIMVAMLFRAVRQQDDADVGNILRVEAVGSRAPDNKLAVY